MIFEMQISLADIFLHMSFALNQQHRFRIFVRIRVATLIAVHFCVFRSRACHRSVFQVCRFCYGWHFWRFGAVTREARHDCFEMSSCDFLLQPIQSRMQLYWSRQFDFFQLDQSWVFGTRPKQMSSWINVWCLHEVSKQLVFLYFSKFPSLHRTMPCCAHPLSVVDLDFAKLHNFFKGCQISAELKPKKVPEHCCARSRCWLGEVPMILIKLWMMEGMRLCSSTKGKEFEKCAKDKNDLPNPESTSNPEFKCVLQTILDSFKVGPTHGVQWQRLAVMSASRPLLAFIGWRWWPSLEGFPPQRIPRDD